MTALIFSQVTKIFGEGFELSEDGIVRIIVLRLEKVLTTAGNKKMSGTPESFNLVDSKSSSK